MTRIMIYGIGGKMGANVISAIDGSDATLVCGVDKFADASKFSDATETCPHMWTYPHSYTHD